MDSKEFKKLFCEVAKYNGFEIEFGGCFKESDESIVVLDLQKSNFGNYYELNVKIFIQGVFGTAYKKSKDLVEKDVGDIFRRQPNEHRNLFDLEFSITDLVREEQLKIFFKDFINPFSEKALSKSGIFELASKEEIKLLPAVKDELNKLTNL